MTMTQPPPTTWGAMWYHVTATIGPNREITFRGGPATVVAINERHRMMDVSFRSPGSDAPGVDAWGWQRWPDRCVTLPDGARIGSILCSDTTIEVYDADALCTTLRIDASCGLRLAWIGPRRDVRTVQPDAGALNLKISSEQDVSLSGFDLRMLEKVPGRFNMILPGRVYFHDVRITEKLALHTTCTDVYFTSGAILAPDCVCTCSSDTGPWVYDERCRVFKAPPEKPRDAPLRTATADGSCVICLEDPAVVHCERCDALTACTPCYRRWAAADSEKGYRCIVCRK